MDCGDCIRCNIRKNTVTDQLSVQCEFNSITAARIISIPSPERTVSCSEKTSIPIKAATIGSIVARIPALLASTVRRPIVYARNGITAVTIAVKTHNNSRAAGFGAAEIFVLVHPEFTFIEDTQ